MQIVYLSNRPENLQDTLQQVAVFMPFIDNALVCVPDAQRTAFEQIETRLPLKLVLESDILNQQEQQSLAKLDHQKRNYLLRSRLIEKAVTDEIFIMSDDDARPLKPIAGSVFIENDKYHRYFFHDLWQWNNYQTEFDVGQISTGVILQHHGLPHLAYASHMPQIIDRQMFLESVSFFEPFVKEHSICEWASYFNFAGAKYQTCFHEPRSYKSLCWPEHPLAWQPLQQPENYLFENYTPSLYQQGQPFFDLTTAGGDVETSLTKIIRWRQHQILSSNPEQAPGVAKYLKLRTWVNKVFPHK